MAKLPTVDTIGRRIKRINGGPCASPACDRIATRRGLCTGHYSRLLQGGDLTTPLKRHRPPGSPVPACRHKGCEKPSEAKGWCNAHYSRDRRNQDMDLPIRRFFVGEKVGYTGAHLRCRTLWGAAKSHPCIECGKQAQDWAYDGTDPTEIFAEVEGSFIAYSLYPEFYMSMCRSCHKRKDGSRIAAELREYREWKQRTGLTVRDVA